MRALIQYRDPKKPRSGAGGAPRRRMDLVGYGPKLPAETLKQGEGGKGQGAQAGGKRQGLRTRADVRAKAQSKLNDSRASAVESAG